MNSQAAPRSDGPEVFFSRELSWLGFARRVLALVEDEDLPLLERVKFAGIVGTLHDEFFMKRMSGLKRQIAKGSRKLSLDGRQPAEEFAACRDELLAQSERVADVVRDKLRPALRAERLSILDWPELTAGQRALVREYFAASVLPILTPLAVDAEHPFPFISSLGLNIAIIAPGEEPAWGRFIRIKVPDNRPRFVPLEGMGWVPLEQVIAANLDLALPGPAPAAVYLFRVTRGASGEPEAADDLHDDDLQQPGSIVRQVAAELKARRFAGVVRLQVQPGMPEELVTWLASQLGSVADDIYRAEDLLGLRDLLRLPAPGRDELKYPPHAPVVHPRLRSLPRTAPDAIFGEIERGDILLHHPYDDFDSSVLRFLEAAAADPQVLAIKLTIYRTSSDSPIVRALAEAARRGKQVAVLVEITARFDEAPNIAWGQYLEKEGVHVAYGVEALKTHVKLALVVREEEGRVRAYAHIGTGNYHTGTARIYEDFGLLTCEPDICSDAATVFNELTGGRPYGRHRRMLVAPLYLREGFIELIRRETAHAVAGRPAGIYGKMNQLQDAEIIRELYKASAAGVPITLNVRGLCCLRPGAAGLSESIRVYSVIGRFLEHSRLYRFTNGGAPEYFTGSADWMTRNLANRVESIVPVLDPDVRRQLDRIIGVYEADNCSAWDCLPDGSYRRRSPRPGESRRAAQEVFMGAAFGAGGITADMGEEDDLTESVPSAQAAWSAAGGADLAPRAPAAAADETDALPA